MLRLEDRWIWDFWLARDGADHHVFYLQADRALIDADRRHVAASIGHAVSNGCIRVPNATLKRLFAVTAAGTPVVIHP